MYGGRVRTTIFGKSQIRPMKKLFSLYIFCFFCHMATAQMVEKSVKGTFLLENATIETVANGQQTGSVLIQDGMIKGVGSNLSGVPGDATRIDCNGMTIYPGFIDGGTRLGLSEVGSVSLTQDYREMGDFTPHMKALTAVNPNSVSIPVTRVNGVTTVLAVPSGGKFAGQAALIDLHGYTPDQMFAGFETAVLYFPSTGKRGRWDRRSEEDIKKDSEKSMKKLNDVWKSAQQFVKIKNDATYNPQMEALRTIVEGKQKLLVEVNKKADILQAIAWCNKNKIAPIFTGVAEGWRVTDSLVKYKIPVITGPVLRNPARDSDKYDAAYTNAGKMLAAGVKVAIKTDETENVRNLPFHAGFAAAYGMGKEAALRAITLTPAEIFGLADKYGSIEEGKVANLFIADGDPFEMKTTIKHLFIRGYKVPMESRHTLLHDEFLERDPGLRQ